MPKNPITVQLPNDLPTDWTYGKTVGPNGTDVGLTKQYGYNYLMQQVNAAQEAAKELGVAFEKLSGDDIPETDGSEKSLSTALSNKADKVKPKRYDFSFSEGFQAYQPCQYWKNEFDEVTIQIGAMKNNVLITSGADAIIGNMPVGFRPKHQIYFPAVAQLSYCTGFINAAGEVVVATKSDIPSGSKFTALTISYLAE